MKLPSTLCEKHRDIFRGYIEGCPLCTAWEKHPQEYYGFRAAYRVGRKRAERAMRDRAAENMQSMRALNDATLRAEKAEARLASAITLLRGLNPYNLDTVDTFLKGLADG